MTDTEIPVFIGLPDNNLRSIALDGVELHTSKISKAALDMQHYMRILSDTPIYDAGIDEALKNAEDTLTAALLVTRIAQEQIKKHRN